MNSELRTIPIAEYEASPGFYLGNSAFNPEWMVQLGIPEPGVIMDIGAYDAGDAIRLKKRFPNARVIAFEADPHRAERIKRFIGDYNIEFHRAAITDTTDPVPFFPSLCLSKDAGSTHIKGTPGGQGSLFRHSENYKTTYPQIRQSENNIIVQGITLAHFCKTYMINNIDLLHIDVEGAEMNVLKGIDWKITKPRVIFLETLDGMFQNNNSSAQEIYAFLTGHRYTLAGDFGTDKLYKVNELV